MNNEVDNIGIEVVDWKYLLNIYQLSSYLTRNDLIQLSLSCKQLRLKLKSRFHSKMELMRGGEVIPGKPNEPSKKKQLISLFDILEEDYLDRYNIVNHCIIWRFFNSRFARSFFNLFTNITQLELYSGYNDDYNIYHSNNDIIGSNIVLIEALYPLKNLESLKIGCELINSSVSCELFLKLPVNLKILHLIERRLMAISPSFYPIENINKEYSNLKKVTIINNKMLSNMATKMEALTDVTIFNDQDFSKSNLAQFFMLNPQLEKLTAPVYFLECNLANSILQMNQLKQLNIESSYYGSSDEINNLPVNTSIEHLNINCDINCHVLVSILNNLKSLKVLEFSNFSFYSFMDIDLSAYEGRVPLLHLNKLWYAKDGISSFDNIDVYNNIDKFDRIRFTSMFDLNYFLRNYKGNNFKNWNVFHMDPVNNEEFTLFNKTKE